LLHLKWLKLIKIVKKKVITTSCVKKIVVRN